MHVRARKGKKRGDKKLAGNVSVARASSKKPNANNNITATMFSGEKKRRWRTTKGENYVEQKNDIQTGFGRRSAKKH